MKNYDDVQSHVLKYVYYFERKYIKMNLCAPHQTVSMLKGLHTSPPEKLVPWKNSPSEH